MTQHQPQPEQFDQAPQPANLWGTVARALSQTVEMSPIDGIRTIGNTMAFAAKTVVLMSVQRKIPEGMQGESHLLLDKAAQRVTRHAIEG